MEANTGIRMEAIPAMAIHIPYLETARTTVIHMTAAIVMATLTMTAMAIRMNATDTDTHTAATIMDTLTAAAMAIKYSKVFSFIF
jgi:hypothetical protein